jgi:hypothetical protein
MTDPGPRARRARPAPARLPIVLLFGAIVAAVVVWEADHLATRQAPPLAAVAALTTPSPAATEPAVAPTGIPAVPATEERATEAQNPAPTATAPPPAPAPTPTPQLRSFVEQGALLPAHRILTYYGHPHDPNMGILGEYEKEDLLPLLLAEAANYEAADPTRPVIPAFEVIATVAQRDPGDDGDYLLETDMETIVEYANFAEANGALLFLDLQIGRSTVEAEVAKVREILRRPHVHLALDPEFAIRADETPGVHIGELTAEQILIAQQTLAQIVREEGIPPKILIVHQFREDMIIGKSRIATVPGVQVVIDADGYGSPKLKTDSYNYLIREAPVGFPGFKLFYRQDEPLMSASDVLALDPPPILIIYQ